MPSNSVDNNKLTGDIIFWAALKRTYLGFPIECPLINITTIAQANPDKHVSNLIRSQYQQERGSFRAFYKGGSSYLAKLLIRSTYHTTGIIYFRNLFGELARKAGIPDAHIITPRNIATSFMMTTINTAIINPLERFRVYVNTQEGRVNLREYTKQPIRQLNKGFNANYLKSIMSWTIFLVTEEKIRLSLLNHSPFQNPTKQQLSIANLFILGICSATPNLAVTLPFETVTTQIQKKDSPHKHILQTFRYIKSNHGFAGFYSSWRPRLVHYIASSIFSSVAIQEAHHLQACAVKITNGE